jgi:transposase-like protein
MAVIDDASAATLTGFVPENVAIGSTVHTAAWRGYRPLDKLGYDHQPRSQRAARSAGEDIDEILPRVHRVISNLKTWLQGTYRGVSGEHLPVYLDEYTFRFNRRRTPMAAFQTLLRLRASNSPRPTAASSRPAGTRPAERSQSDKHQCARCCDVEFTDLPPIRRAVRRLTGGGRRLGSRCVRRVRWCPRCG